MLLFMSGWRTLNYIVSPTALKPKLCPWFKQMKDMISCDPCFCAKHIYQIKLYVIDHCRGTLSFNFLQMERAQTAASATELTQLSLSFLLKDTSTGKKPAAQGLEPLQFLLTAEGLIYIRFSRLSSRTLCLWCADSKISTLPGRLSNVKRTID